MSESVGRESEPRERLESEREDRREEEEKKSAAVLSRHVSVAAHALDRSAARASSRLSGNCKHLPSSPSATLFSRSSTRYRPACVRDAAGGCAVIGGRRRAPSPSVVAAACAARSRSLILAPAIPAREREQFQGAIFRRLGGIYAFPDRCSDCEKETFSRRKWQVRDKREKGKEN